MSLSDCGRGKENVYLYCILIMKEVKQMIGILFTWMAIMALEYIIVDIFIDLIKGGRYL